MKVKWKIFVTLGQSALKAIIVFCRNFSQLIFISCAWLINSLLNINHDFQILSLLGLFIFYWWQSYYSAWFQSLWIINLPICLSYLVSIQFTDGNLLFVQYGPHHFILMNLPCMFIIFGVHSVYRRQSYLFSMSRSLCTIELIICLSYLVSVLFSDGNLIVQHGPHHFVLMNLSICLSHFVSILIERMSTSSDKFIKSELSKERSVYKIYICL